MVEEALGELLLDRLHVLLVQVRPDQPDAAVDVEADAACERTFLIGSFPPLFKIIFFVFDGTLLIVTSMFVKDRKQERREE